MGSQEMLSPLLQARVFNCEKHLRGAGAVARQTTGISQALTAQPESDLGAPVSPLP